MKIATLEGITEKTISTDRITTRVLFAGPEDGIPVLFLHGNVSSATWWEETMITLPEGFRGIAPDQRGFGEAECKDLANWMCDVIDAKGDQSTIDAVKAKVLEVCNRLPVYK